MLVDYVDYYNDKQETYNTIRFLVVVVVVVIFLMDTFNSLFSVIEYKGVSQTYKSYG